MRFDEKTVTVNHHDYLLSGYDYSDYYKVDIIPDYYMFEDGMACSANAACYDMGDTIDVHYLVYITPKGKNKSKVVLDEEETIDKEDFDYINDSVFVMICEWIDNRYGKELFESKKSTKKTAKSSKKNTTKKSKKKTTKSSKKNTKKTTKRSLKESDYDLINDDLLAMCKGSTKQLIYAMDNYQSNYSDRNLKELKRRIEEVKDFCDRILYQINK